MAMMRRTGELLGYMCEKLQSAWLIVLTLLRTERHACSRSDISPSGLHSRSDLWEGRSPAVPRSRARVSSRLSVDSM